MNKLPIEIENSIWNMYYMDHYCKSINELRNIVNLSSSFHIRIEEVKKCVRKYRFYGTCDDNTRQLFMIINQEMSTVYNSKINRILKLIPFVDKKNNNIFPENYNYICEYLLDKYSYKEKATDMLKTMLKY